MKKSVWWLLCVIPMIAAAKEEPRYPVSSIPAALLKNADVVVREDSTHFSIKSTSKTVLYHYTAITILNEKGDEAAEFGEYYDQLRSIAYISGTLYDAAGREVKSLAKKDIKDISAAGESLAADDRYKLHNFYCRSYPYTVAYETEIDFSQSMFFPVWRPQSAGRMSVEHSSLAVTCPADYRLRYEAFNYKEKPVSEKDDDRKDYTWSIHAVPAIEEEYACPELEELTPSVTLGPTKFEIQGYDGNMATWEDFGKFQYALNAGRDKLPPDIKRTVHQLTDKLATPREKVIALYHFMQENTHYISIQLGIGGWQPFDAEYVATKRYGDCKALSNYMYALLKEAGIPSYYTVVHGGRESHFFRSNFPSSQFNHVIISVPLARDTMWLECTSQTLPAGYLSSFTDDRYALQVRENGGALVRTPVYGLKENVQLDHVTATLDSEGNLAIRSTARYQGLIQDELHENLASLSKEKMLARLKEQIDLPQYDVVHYQYAEEAADLPGITETLQLTAGNYAQRTGKRLFLVPNIMNRNRRKLTADDTRKYEVVLRHAYSELDSVSIELPVGYVPESIPAPVTLAGKFGDYICTARFEDGKLDYYRKFDSYSGHFPAGDYKELVAFRNQICKADGEKVVLVRK